VSGFRLDKYDVTVGRFNQFVTAWNHGNGWMPPAGSGKHTHLNGGLGLANSGSNGTYEPGWLTSDNGNISPIADANGCQGGDLPNASTLTANNQRLPINCVNWFEAYAFCIWDGGFLPSEAEWEYAAAGGSQQRVYPWGSTDPGTGNEYAIYGDGQGNCYYPSGTVALCAGLASIASVGTPTLGAGRWGQLDLAGEMSEWTIDHYWDSGYANPCVDCAYLTAQVNGNPSRVQRGTAFVGSDFYYMLPLTPNYCPGSPSAGADENVGFRCARTP
jgi:formylglycine-generating enzyme required for sulfatase activity